MSKLSSVLKKTGIAVAAAAMLVTMGAGTVVTQAKTSLPVYKVSLAKKYTNHQKDKRMEASVKIPKVKITGTDGKVMKSESEKLNAAISSYQNKFIKDYKKDVADVKSMIYEYNSYTGQMDKKQMSFLSGKIRCKRIINAKRKKSFCMQKMRKEDR